MTRSCWLALAIIVARPLAAQDSARFVSIGSVAEDRQRLLQLTGERSAAGWMARTAMQMSDTLPRDIRVDVSGMCTLALDVIPAAVSLTWNSELPFARNDGGVWAGRGRTVLASAGVRGRCGPLRGQFAPEIWRSENEHYQVLPSPNLNRSNFANPFHWSPASSIDMPSRLGTSPVTVLQGGQSSISVVAGPVEVGWGTQSEWWGPGIRNALVMSNNSAGIPAYFVTTPRPIHTRAGAFHARWIAGYLTESNYYERQGHGFLRPLSGLVLSYSPAADTNLTIGAARAVYRRLTGSPYIPDHAFDVVSRWTVRTEEGNNSADQLSSVFARWVFPESGFEAYGEYARVILPSLRQLLVAPHHNAGYTVGLQWLSEAHRLGRWRAQLELTNLEQVRLSRTETPSSFYASNIIYSGYTQRGRVIGAAIGPGSQSQWVALDAMRERGSAGIFAGRIRWDHDEFFPQPSGLSFYAHDVSLFAGLRGTWRGRYFDYAAEMATEQRMNYLFQSAVGGYGDDRTFDIHNLSLRLSIAPGLR